VEFFCDKYDLASSVELLVAQSITIIHLFSGIGVGYWAVVRGSSYKF